MENRHGGGESAADRLVEANLRLATFIANSYRRQGVNHDDFLREARSGLRLAAQHYDAEMGIPFTSYASWWIDARVRRFLGRHASAMRG